MEAESVNSDTEPTSVATAQGGQATSKPIPLQYGLAAPRFVVPIPVTIAVVALSTIVAAYMYALFRTTGWGFSFRGFLLISLVSLGFSAPFVLIGSFGRRIRTMLICLTIVAVVPPMIAETWAGLQERSLVRRARLTPGVPMGEPRWWPFGSHGIGTDGKTFYGYD